MCGTPSLSRTISTEEVRPVMARVPLRAGTVVLSHVYARPPAPSTSSRQKARSRAAQFTTRFMARHPMEGGSFADRGSDVIAPSQGQVRPPDCLWCLSGFPYWGLGGRNHDLSSRQARGLSLRLSLGVSY